MEVSTGEWYGILCTNLTQTCHFHPELPLTLQVFHNSKTQIISQFKVSSKIKAWKCSKIESESCKVHGQRGPIKKSIKRNPANYYFPFSALPVPVPLPHTLPMLLPLLLPLSMPMSLPFLLTIQIYRISWPVEMG